MILESIRKKFRSSIAKPAKPRVPDGERYYIVGDIHGRCDLFEALIKAIEADDRSGAPADTTIVLLGDLVDRGSDSAGVLRRARQWQQQRRVRILTGNHEEMFIESLADKEVLRHFLKHGGRETILSYGIPSREFNELTIDELFERLPSLIANEDLEFIATFEERIVCGDYLFVHAGIDPLVPIEDQKRRDMLWIRDRFLRHKGPLEKIVVHGHTIYDEVEDCGNRIGIDTGAFRTGLLTALVLEEDRRRTIQAANDGETIEIISGELAS